MSELPLCACGCGERVSKIGNKFIRWHHGKFHSKESLERAGEKIKKLYQQEDGPYSTAYRKKQSTLTKDRIERDKLTEKWDEIRKKLSDALKGNKNGQYISQETKYERAKNQVYRVKDYQEKYPTFSKEEEIRDNENFEIGKPGIEVRCKYCRKWFVPTKGKLESRVLAVEYNNMGGGCYLYCCEECKYKCPHFNVYIMSYLKSDNRPTDQQLAIWRNEVLKEADYVCEYCGEKATTAHHIEPIKLRPEFALDPSNGLACCKGCHDSYGHKPGTECSYGHLATKVCL